MAADSYYDGSSDPYDPEAAIRQRVLDQLSQGDAAPVADTSSQSSTPSPDFNAAPAPAPFLAGDQYTPTPAAAPAAPATADPSLLGPNYSGPAPASFGGPATSADQVPVPGVNPGVVYTDQSGRGYTPDELYANRNALLQDPANARIRDILSTYGYGGAAPAATQKRGGAAAGGGLSFAGTGATGGDTSWRDSIRQIIMKRLLADQGPIDENAPNIVAALNAAKDQLTRQSTTERDQLAERLYAQQGGGLNTDAVTQGVQQSNERMGTGLSTLRANLIQSAYKDRLTELNHLLDLATQTGDTEQAQQIQLSMANLQAALQREGLGVNLAEFGAQLDQNSVLAGLR